MSIAETSISAPLERSETIFSAILHPHRSLGHKGFLWLMAIVGTSMIGMSVYFFTLGAWPIVGFAGLDVALLYWAFRRNFRDAQIYEKLHITDREVTIHQICANGRRQHHAFNPYWVRLETDHEEDRGMVKLALTSHGRSVEIGAFLYACERESLAEALKSALWDAKMASTQVSGG